MKTHTTQIRTLSVTFDEILSAEELPEFREAISDKVGFERELFHNNEQLSETDSVPAYSYPLIQYTRFRGLPAILFIGQAVEEARHFFAQDDWTLELQRRIYTANVADLRAKQYRIGVTPGHYRTYRLQRWIALNEDNFAHYQRLETLVKKIELLERVLAGHILGLASGLGVQFAEKFTVRLSDLTSRRPVPYRGVKLMAFDVQFRADVELPATVGLGKGSAIGFGRLWHHTKETDNANRKVEAEHEG